MTTAVGPISIAIAAVAPCGRDGRREAERRAVAQCLDELRAAMPDIPPYEAIAHDEHGAPSLPGWQLSVTHSRAVAAVAICRAGASPAFGIDAEEWRPALLKVREKYLSPAEASRPLSHADLLRLWTIKEAVYKAAADPSLPLPAINADPSLALATARGRSYSLHPIPHPLSTITLAMEIETNHDNRD